MGDARGGFGCRETAGRITWHQKDESGMASPIAAVAFSPDGKRLAVADDPDEGRGYLATGYHVPLAGADGTIRVIDLTTKKTLHELTTDASEGLHTIAFAADGQALLAAYEDGFLRKWDAASGTLLASYRLQAEPWYFTPIAFSCDAKWLAVRERRGGPVAVWTLAPVQKASAVNVSTDPTDILALARGARLLAIADPDDEEGEVSLYRVPEK